MNPLLIGITGGIGSGKTTVCRVLNELGYPVFDADSAGKQLLKNDPEIVDSVKKLLGESAYKNDLPDTKFIARQVYENKDQLAALNAIIHPAVAENFKQWVHNNRDHKLLFKESAILFESGADKEMDLVIALDATPEIRMNRIIERDGRPESEIKKIMESQLTGDELKAKSDFVIINNEKQPVLIQIQSILKKIESSVQEFKKS